MQATTIRRTVLSILSLFLLCAVQRSYAQEDSSRFVFPKFSLQLRIVDFLQFSDFQGASVSFKYHFNNPSALRIGIGFSANKSNTDIRSYTLETDSLLGKNSEEDARYYTRIYAQYIIYPKIYSTIKFYVDAGPSYSWSNSISEDTYWDSDSGKSLPYRDYSYNYKTFGLDFVMGVEWFFAQKMSLLLDYSFSINYFENETEIVRYRYYTPPVKQVAKTHGSFFRWNQIKFGLSVYL